MHVLFDALRWIGGLRFKGFYFDPKVPYRIEPSVHIVAAHSGTCETCKNTESIGFIPECKFSPRHLVDSP